MLNAKTGIMKRILGLDLGTNSIGWALIEQDFNASKGKILGIGSRIIPMSQEILGDFGKGNSVSQTAERTNYRSNRRIRERFLLRRERLHRVLNIIGFLPEHYSAQIEFKSRLGKFVDNAEPKIAYHNNEFIFKSSFKEMLKEFESCMPSFVKNEKGDRMLVPYDWTIYYLRKKGLTEKISKEELAWIILNFNQKRGYYQLRGEEEEDNPNKLVEFHSLKVTEVVADEMQKGKSEIWYSVILENGWTYRRSSKIPLFDWKDKIKDFIVTTDLNDDGTIRKDRDGLEKRSFRAPSDTDWTLIKKKTESEIDKSLKTIGEYIFDNMLHNPKQKINGKLIRTIERKYYKSELNKILSKQAEFHKELVDEHLYNECIRELYNKNDVQQQFLSKRDFTHLFIEDIIFYQRPLRSKKSLINNCTLEFYTYKNREGLESIKYLKAIPKSNPYYQEFRIWQWMYNLSVYNKSEDINVTSEFFNSIKEWEDLFEFLNDRKEIDQKTLIKYLLEKKGFKGKSLNSEIEKYRWNYVEDKKYPCNETRAILRTRIEKVFGESNNYLTRETEQKLWHLIYSVTDKIEYEKAIHSFAAKHDFNERLFVDAFKKIPPFKSEYGTFSEKAIKKLLPLMRIGKFWSWNMIDYDSQERIKKIISGEFDECIKDRVRDKAKNLKTATDFQGLQLWLAQYIVYDRHSEGASSEKWNCVEDIEEFLQTFKQHSLRNPIVEQVVMETIRVIKDVWFYYGENAKDYFSEIHVELGREMKLPAEERKKISNINIENENTNLRIKALLSELNNDSNVENVRPYSPIQQEILKIYEEGVLNSDIEIEEDIIKISKSAQPSQSELKRYKLWLEQKYRSPYTGEIIPLNKLFTTDYEIEHIIPQSRYFDDSYSNKVICESIVNKQKGNFLGYEFIKECHGQILECGFGKKVRIFEIDEYEDFVKKHYAANRSKRNKLLMEEIQEKMIERQLNDTRYISKYISSILSNIVREQQNDDGVNSKNIIPVSGKITSTLKNDWGLNGVWNDLVLPRFERMNKLTNSNSFTVWNEKFQKHLPTVPLELSKNFSVKRIDHRHHALDALVIACASRDHVNLLNNMYAKSVVRHDLNRKLRLFEKTIYTDNKTGERIERDVPKAFIKPWKDFIVNARDAIEAIIISYKQNLRVINKANNYYDKWVIKDNIIKKDRVKQEGRNWAIRKPMHKDTVSGLIDLPWVKVPKDKILTATRKSLDTTFDFKTISSITDTGIQKILRNYLERKGGNPELAFSPEGKEDLNNNIADYNEGKHHQPITKVRVFEIGSKFPIGEKGNKKAKYVEAAKGTNLFFAIYQNREQKRNYDTIPLNIVIERLKAGLTAVPEINEKGDNLLFYLSPNDLVYVPTEDEKENIKNIDFDNLTKEQKGRIYRMVSCTGNECHFSHSNISALIKSYDSKTKVGELGSLNKSELTLDQSIRIKEQCIKLSISRLGKVI
jgi:CRISPR-associated endonuclease Csn1